ncbi:DiGeorge syndrome critical region protein 14, partial [Cladochytrium tenue]
ALGERLQRLATGASGVAADGSETPLPPRLDTPLVTGFTPVASSADRTPSQFSSAAAAAEVIGSDSGGDAEEAAAAAAAAGMSLDAFQAAYTSEDNASFNAILQRVNDDRRAGYRWVYDQEKKALVLGDSQRPALESSDTAGSKVAGLLTGPDDGFAKPVASWKYKAKNELMYHPPAAPETLADAAEITGAPKAINHGATRLARGVAAAPELLAASRAAAERLQTQEAWRDMAAATPALFPGVGGGGGAAATPLSAPVPSTPSLEPHADVDP